MPSDDVPTELVRIAEDLGKVLDRLEEQNIPHMVVGALALDALDVPRATMDVDLQVVVDEPPAEHETRFLGLFIEERSRDETFGQDVLITHLPTRATPFEIFLTSHPFTLQALERRQEGTISLLGRPVPIPTVEDFLVMKAAFHVATNRRRKKRIQDGVDLENVILGHLEDIDWGYVEEHARELGCWSTLEEIRDDVRKNPRAT